MSSAANGGEAGGAADPLNNSKTLRAALQLGSNFFNKKNVLSARATNKRLMTKVNQLNPNFPRIINEQYYNELLEALDTIFNYRSSPQEKQEAIDTYHNIINRPDIESILKVDEENPILLNTILSKLDFDASGRERVDPLPYLTALIENGINPSKGVFGLNRRPPLAQYLITVFENNQYPREEIVSLLVVKGKTLHEYIYDDDMAKAGHRTLNLYGWLYLKIASIVKSFKEATNTNLKEKLKRDAQVYDAIYKKLIEGASGGRRRVRKTRKSKQSKRSTRRR